MYSRSSSFMKLHRLQVCLCLFHINQNFYSLRRALAPTALPPSFKASRPSQGILLRCLSFLQLVRAPNHYLCFTFMTLTSYTWWSHYYFSCGCVIWIQWVHTHLIHGMGIIIYHITAEVPGSEGRCHMLFRTDVIFSHQMTIMFLNHLNIPF